MIAWHGADDAVIDAAGLPVLALDYAASRDGIVPALWKDTGLDGPSAPSGATLTPRQYLRLLDNTARLLGSPDTSFMLGQRMLPGTEAHAAGALAGLACALRHAPSLRVALALLVDWQPLLSPLLCPRLRVDGDQAALYWTDSYGAPGMLPFLVEMHMAAVASLCRWLSGERLPWRFCFNRGRPRHAEQHEVHLGHDLRFGCHLDVMLLDAAWLDRPWPGGDAVRMEQGLAAAGRLAIPPSLPSALYGYLLERVRNAPPLEQAAHDFGVSPATLKRKLARHHTHYQAELDLARTHMALYLFQSRRAGNEAVARELGFNDAANFRRSFKRWTGSAPGLLRDWLLA
ncbi:MAG: AraC family transcriptional regulator [Burkholderiaceae bacterium]|nr:AraC family transcriptional regulator [Burkholderiaceae bacterium]